MNTKIYKLFLTCAVLIICAMSVLIYKEERHGHWMLHYYQRHFDPQVPDITERPDYWCIQGWTGTLKKLNLDCDICFFGHSQISGIDYQQNYPNKKMITLGYPGETAEGMILRIEQVKCVKPEKVFFQEGANSLWWTDERFDENYNAVIDSLRKAVPDAKLYVINILPMRNGTLGSSQRNESIHHRNEYIANYCSTHDLTLIDAYSAFADSIGDLREELSIDGVHFNADGYEVLRHQLDPYIKE